MIQHYRDGGPISSGQPHFNEGPREQVVPPPRGTSPFSGRPDLTEAEAKQLADRFKDAAVAAPGYSYPIEHEIIDTPTAWKSAPGVVRLAVWLWALVTVLGFAIGLVWSVIWVILLLVTFGQQ